mgnify:FL=1
MYVFKRSPIDTESLSSIPAKNIFYSLKPVLKEVDIVILAVKAQDFQSLASILKEYISEHHNILSVMAGVRINKIQHLLKVDKLFVVCQTYLRKLVEE